MAHNQIVILLLLFKYITGSNWFHRNRRVSKRVCMYVFFFYFYFSFIFSFFCPCLFVFIIYVFHKKSTALSLKSSEFILNMLKGLCCVQHFYSVPSSLPGITFLMTTFVTTLITFNHQNDCSTPLFMRTSFLALCSSVPIGFLVLGVGCQTNI
jgi:hypothetical protein